MNSSKDNRGAADYGELTLIKNLCAYAGIDFSYKKELKAQQDKLLNKPQGKLKKSQQDRVSKLLLKGCLQAIQKTFTKCDIKDVRWVGRQKKNSTEDVLVVTNKGCVLISLKVTQKGSGTLKNLGARSLKSIGVDLSSAKEAMYEAVLKKASRQYSFKSGIRDLKEKSRTNNSIVLMADEVSREHIEAMNTKIFKAMKALKDKDLRSFIQDRIMGGKKSVWAVFVNGDTLEVYNQTKALEIKSTDVVEVKASSDVGLKIHKNGKPWIRANTCCTNGKGLSAVCQRYFLE